MDKEKYENKNNIRKTHWHIRDDQFIMCGLRFKRHPLKLVTSLPKGDKVNAKPKMSQFIELVGWRNSVVLSCPGIRCTRPQIMAMLSLRLAVNLEHFWLCKPFTSPLGRHLTNRRGCLLNQSPDKVHLITQSTHTNLEQSNNQRKKYANILF